MGVEVGSGVKVAVVVFSTGITSVACAMDVVSTCSIGVEVDVTGLAQADRDMAIANSRDAICFIDPLSCVWWSRNLDCTSIDVLGSFRTNRFENRY